MAKEGRAEIEMGWLENFLNRSLCTSPCLSRWSRKDKCFRETNWRIKTDTKI